MSRSHDHSTATPAHPATPPLPTAPSHHVAYGLALALALAIGLLPLPGLLAAIGLALALALPLLNPVFGAYLAVLSVPAQDLVQLPGGLSLTQAAVAVAAAAWLLRSAPAWLSGRSPSPGTPDPTPSTRTLAAWSLLLWALLLSASLTPLSRTEGLKETARWGVAFLVWLIAVTSVRRRWELYGLVACLLAAPALCAAVGLAQFATGDGPPAFRIAANLPYVRAYGTIGQPNSFAGYLNMAWPLAVAVAVAACSTQRAAWQRRSPARRALGAAACALPLLLAALLLGGLAASFSRGAWLGAAAGLMALAATLGRRAAAGVAAAGAAGALALALGGAGLLPEPLARRVASISRSVGFFDPSTVTVTPENFAVVERMAHLRAGWRMLQAHPLLGVGPGNFGAAYPEVTAGPWYVSRGHAHNFFLHIAAEAGVVGLAAYLLLLGAVAAEALRAVRRAPDALLRGIAAGCCGIIAAVAGHSLFENLHVLNMGIQLAGVWAAAAVIASGRLERATPLATE